jgi:hypothetical protein
MPGDYTSYFKLQMRWLRVRAPGSYPLAASLQLELFRLSIYKCCLLK